MKKTARMWELEAERGMPIRAIVDAAAAAGKTNAEIAAELGISTVSLRNWLSGMRLELVRARRVQPLENERETALAGR